MCGNITRGTRSCVISVFTCRCFILFHPSERGYHICNYRNRGNKRFRALTDLCILEGGKTQLECMAAAHQRKTPFHIQKKNSNGKIVVCAYIKKTSGLWEVAPFFEK